MILKFLKRIFGRDDSDPAQPAHVASTTTASSGKRAAEKEKPVASDIEVASLSLRAILDKLPADLHAIIERLPEPGVKIMLPLNSIIKQLPTGAVRMSLASVLRQAPAGTFRKTGVEGKQMVDVPLSEVFRNIDPKRLGRRSDQRRYDVPDDNAGFFDRTGGSQGLNAAPAPNRTDIPQPAVESPDVAPAPASRPSVLKMPSAAAPGNIGNGKAHAPASAAKTAAPAGGSGELVISFVELAAGWPEGVRSELSFVPGDTKLVIPQQAVSPGLQKGKVIFPWAQVRQWMMPALTSSAAIADDLELVLPLKIIAPSFVAATGATKRREAAEIDHSLPDFFGAVPKPAFKLVQQAPEELPMAKAMTAPTEPPPTAPAPAETAPVEAAAPAPAPAAGPLKFTLVGEPLAPVAESAPVAEPAPVLAMPIFAAPVAEAVLPAAPVAPPQEPAVLTPAELVKRTCALQGVAGAVIALEEGFVVAQSLPGGFSADTFAAFMPQIIARLEKYTVEMLLGATSEITLHTASGPCHIARCGKIYFGTLGRIGEPLPDSLRALTAQLPDLNS